MEPRKEQKPLEDKLGESNHGLSLTFWNECAMSKAKEYTTSIEAAEYATIKVPFDIFNKDYRAAHRTLEVEASTMKRAIEKMEKAQPLDEVSNILNGVIEKLSNLKRKADEGFQEERKSLATCQKRLELIREAECPGPQFKRRRMDRFLVDHLLRNGYYDAAVEYASKANVEECTDVHLVILSRSIEESIMKGNAEPALQWCEQNRTRLKKFESAFEYEVHLFQFNQLVCDNKKMEAIQHARKHLSKIDPSNLELKNYLTSAMGRLALPVDLCKSEDTFSSDWLVKKFRVINCSLFSVTPPSLLSIAVRVGLSSLKLHHCYQEETKVRDCPVCSPTLNRLAKNLPYCRPSQSRLRCAYTGALMDENNPPCMLPNGRVYCSNAIKQLTKDGEIVCPRTQDKFPSDAVKRVFLM